MKRQKKKKKNVLHKLPAEILFKERRIIYQIKDERGQQKVLIANGNHGQPVS